MVFNATLNNISAISWRSVLLVEKTGVPGDKLPTCRKSLTNFFLINYYLLIILIQNVKKVRRY